MNFEKISKEYNTPIETVSSAYEGIVKDLSSKGLEGEMLKELSAEKLELLLRDRGRSGANLFVGYIHGYDAIKDMANPRNKTPKRDVIIEEYIANPEETILEGKVAILTEEDGVVSRTMLRKTGTVKTDIVSPGLWKEFVIEVEGKGIVPLDSIKQWGTGSQNFSYLTPLPLHKWDTTIIGVVKTDKGFSRFSMRYNDTQRPEKIPINTLVEFSATDKGYENDVLKLNKSKYTEFIPSQQDIGISAIESLEQGFESAKMKTSKLDEYHESMKNDKYNTLVLLEAWVKKINFESAMTYLVVDDLSRPIEDGNLKILLHDDIDVDFAEESKILILGRTSRGDKYIPGEGVQVGVPGDISIFAMGILPKFNTKPRIVETI